MQLQTQKREILGKKVKDLREKGYIPAELYGHGKANFHLSVPEKEFTKVYAEAGESSLVDLVVDGEKKQVIIQDVSREPVSDKIFHVDFYEVRMDEKIEATVPLEFIGEAPAVKEKGGIVVKAVKELDVKALPADLPKNIEIDLSSLDDIGKSLYVKDLLVSKGVEILAEPETVVVTISQPISEEEEAAMSAETSVEEVKVETEEKVEARQKEKEEKVEKGESEKDKE